MSRASEKVTYFISNGSSVKIGQTRDVSRRVCALQTSSPKPLIVLLTLPGNHEKVWHERLGFCRESGEWFTLSSAVGLIFEETLHSFRAWVLYHCDLDAPIGDLANDIRDDACFPLGTNNFDLMYRHIAGVRHSGSWEACLTFARAYRDWMRARRRAGVQTSIVGRAARWRTWNSQVVNKTNRQDPVKWLCCPYHETAQQRRLTGSD